MLGTLKWLCLLSFAIAPARASEDPRLVQDVIAGRRSLFAPGGSCDQRPVRRYIKEHGLVELFVRDAPHLVDTFGLPPSISNFVHQRGLVDSSIYKALRDVLFLGRAVRRISESYAVRTDYTIGILQGPATNSAAVRAVFSPIELSGGTYFDIARFVVDGDGGVHPLDIKALAKAFRKGAPSSAKTAYHEKLIEAFAEVLGGYRVFKSQAEIDYFRRQPRAMAVERYKTAVKSLKSISVSKSESGSLIYTVFTRKTESVAGNAMLCELGKYSFEFIEGRQLGQARSEPEPALNRYNSEGCLPLDYAGSVAVPAH